MTDPESRGDDPSSPAAGSPTRQPDDPNAVRGRPSDAPAATTTAPATAAAAPAPAAAPAAAPTPAPAPAPAAAAAPAPATTPAPAAAPVLHPPFAPLFTLVNNSTTRSIHHPQVRYIFSDDDPDLLTQFLAQHEAEAAAAASAESPAASASAPAGVDGHPPSRAVVLDLAPTTEGSWEVSAVSSISADWAVVDARVSRMEEDDHGRHGHHHHHRHHIRVSQGDDEDEGGAGPANLMLKIDGVEHDPTPHAAAALEADMPSSGSGAQVAGREDYAALIAEFERRMGVMRRVVAGGTAAETVTLTTQIAASATEKGKEKEEGG